MRTARSVKARPSNSAGSSACRAVGKALSAVRTRHDTKRVLEARSQRTPRSSHARMRDESCGRNTPLKRRRVTAGFAQFSQGSFTNHAGTREYKLFIPSNYHGQRLPLVVMLHGCSQTVDEFAMGTRMNILAEERECVIAYPIQATGANGLRCWNWFSRAHQQRGRGEPCIIAGLARELVTSYGLDVNRVYVAGLSAGGAMAVILGQTYPDVFAAIGVHSGLPYRIAHDLRSAYAAMEGCSKAGVSAPVNSIFVPAAATTSIPTIVFHGDGDTTVHPINSYVVAAQSAAIGELPVAPVSITKIGMPVRRSAPEDRSCRRTIYADVSGRVVVEQWLVRGGGHAWFGGSPCASFMDPLGPDASNEMMRFFHDHSLRKCN
jgi:poly(hydroxyalkanoate) depolymerase family esterase